MSGVPSDPAAPESVRGSGATGAATSAASPDPQPAVAPPAPGRRSWKHHHGWTADLEHGIPPWAWDAALDDSEPRFRLGRRARLWVPVVVSFLLQVPYALGLAIAGHGASDRLLGLAISLIGPLALIAARRLPGPTVAAVSAAALADLLLVDSYGPPYIALAFAIGSAVNRNARVWAWISVGAGWVVAVTVGTVLTLTWQPPRIAATTLGILIVFGVAEGVRTRRERRAQFRARIAARRQTEVQAERVRIARELHDVLAHSLSQISVQAGVGLHLIDSQPAKAKDALASIKDTSKSALDEVRTVLGVLRAEGGADPSAPLVPEPDLSRLAGLAASVTSQGVDVRVEDTTHDVPRPLQFALYRIAQESLTNVVRHARASRATVTLGDTPGGVEMTIVDDGDGTGSASTAGGGRGLIGMRERAELLGGTLEAAARTDGPGFRVHVRIPRTTEVAP